MLKCLSLLSQKPINQPFLIPTGPLPCRINIVLFLKTTLGSWFLVLQTLMSFLANGSFIKNLILMVVLLVTKLVGSVVVILNNTVLITMKLSLL
jgi:hypothetical protein